MDGTRGSARATLGSLETVMTADQLVEAQRNVADISIDPSLIDYVVSDGIISNAVPVCAHRIITRSHMHDANGSTAVEIIGQVLETVPSPV